VDRSLHKQVSGKRAAGRTTPCAFLTPLRSLPRLGGRGVTAARSPRADRGLRPFVASVSEMLPDDSEHLVAMNVICSAFTVSPSSRASTVP
jgi:hypothetical protein